MAEKKATTKKEKSAAAPAPTGHQAPTGTAARDIGIDVPLPEKACAD